MDKIAFIDIETSPNVVYSWRVGYNLDISYDAIVKERAIICVAYKFEGDPTVHSLDWGNTRNDKQLLRKLAKVLEKVDVVVAHNGDRFDIKWIKTRSMIHGLKPLTDIKSIDTLKLVRSNFNFNSNKLDYLVKLFHLGGKKAAGGYSLWTRCMDGDAEALRDMVEYCKQDVIILEKLFNHIKSHVDKLPVHRGIMKGKEGLSCGACGSSRIQKNGKRAKRSGVYGRYRCGGCGHSFTASKKDKEEL